MAFDVQGALNAGYSLDEIGSHVGFDVAGAKNAGYSDDEIVGHLASGTPKQAPVSATETTGKPKEPGLLSRLNDALVKRGINIADELTPRSPDESIGQSIVKAPERALRVTGQAAGFLGDLIGEGAKSLYKTVMPDDAQTAIKETGKDILQTDIGKAGLEAVKTGMDTYSQFKVENPNAAKDLEAVVNIGTMFPIGKATQLTGAATKEGALVAKDLASWAVRKTPQSIDKAISNIVKSNVTKAVKTSTSGKATWPLVEGYFKSAEGAVKDIIENKNNLKFTNAIGEEVTGVLPKTRAEFASAIHDTKGKIFDEYNSMQKAAGKKGASIDLEPIATELDSVINDKTLMADIDGRAIIEHTKKQQKFLRDAKSFTPEEAQKWIARANDKLDTFYKNKGTYQEGSKAGVDASVASMIRKAEDAIIGATEGPGYQALKNRYGSLSGLEAGVNKTAFADMGKIKAPNFFDITSGTALVHGLFSMNPAVIGPAGFMEIMNQVRRNMQNPDRYVKKMFTEVEKLMKQKSHAGSFSASSNLFKK